MNLSFRYSFADQASSSCGKFFLSKPQRKIFPCVNHKSIVNRHQTLKLFFQQRLAFRAPKAVIGSSFPA
jgi:hypothetical protein